jgi:hypothetical protein
MGFFEVIWLFLFSMVLFWPVTLGFGLAGIALGLVSVKWLAPRTGTALAIFVGLLISMFVPMWIGEAMFSPEEGLGILAFAWAGGGGLFLGYLLVYCLPVLRRIRIVVDKPGDKQS